jgi:hypothetical protein
MFAFALILALFYAASVLYSLYRVLIVYNINTKAFYRQIRKNIMANNIDRAIKLCNAEPNALAPRLFKAVLTRANRSHAERLMSAQEGIGDVQRRNTSQTIGYLPFLFFSATVIALEGALVATVGMHPWMLIVCGVCMPLGLFAIYKSGKIVRDALYYFDRVFMHMAVRQREVPVNDTPREKLTSKQVAAWREAMNEFTEYVKELRGRDGKFTKGEMPAHVLYTKVADPKTGMLTPGFDRPY